MTEEINQQTHFSERDYLEEVQELLKGGEIVPVVELEHLKVVFAFTQQEMTKMHTANLKLQGQIDAYKDMLKCSQNLNATQK